MKIGSRQRWFVLVALLTLTLTAAAWVRDSDKATDAQVVETPARAVRPVRAAAPQPAAPDRVALDRLQSHRLEFNKADPFESRSWKAPVRKRNASAAVEAPPPPPTAPPLPFVYMGKLVSEEADAVFLVQGERNLVVHRGDTIDQIYRIDDIGGSQIALTHLPTGIRQTLETGEVQ